MLCLHVLHTHDTNRYIPVQTTGKYCAATILVKPTPEPNSNIMELCGKYSLLCNTQSANKRLPRHT